MFRNRGSDVGDCRVYHIGGRDPLPVRIHRRRVDARHVEDVLEKACEAIEFQKRYPCLRLSFLWRKREILKIRNGGTNGCHRGSEVVTEGSKERRGKVGALADG